MLEIPGFRTVVMSCSAFPVVLSLSLSQGHSVAQATGDPATRENKPKQANKKLLFELLT